VRSLINNFFSKHTTIFIIPSRVVAIAAYHREDLLDSTKFSRHLNIYLFHSGEESINIHPRIYSYPLKLSRFGNLIIVTKHQGPS
jgi:hypothetical protein